MNVKIDDKVLYSFAASDAVLWKEQAADELLRDQDGAQGKQLQAVQKNILSPVHLIDMCTQCIILQTASAVSLHSSCLVSPQDCTQTKAGKGSHQRSRLNWDSKLCVSYSNTYLHFRKHVKAKPTSWNVLNLDTPPSMQQTPTDLCSSPGHVIYLTTKVIQVCLISWLSVLDHI